MLAAASRLAVEFDHDLVVAADDQQYRCSQLWQPVGCQVGPSAARDDRANLLAQLRGRPQRRAGAGARAEVADWQSGELRLCLRPASRRDQPPGEQADVEHVRPVLLFFDCQQVEQ